MKKIVVYNSRTGFTKKYAEWIAAELECDTITYKDYIKHPVDCEILIYGSSVMGGLIKGLKKIRKVRHYKHMIVFATGLTPPEAKEITEQIKRNNFMPEEQEQIPFFYFQGGLSFDELGFISRNVLKRIGSMLSKKKDKTQDDILMAEMLKQSADYTDQEYMKPLIYAVKEKIQSNLS